MANLAPTNFKITDTYMYTYQNIWHLKYCYFRLITSLSLVSNNQGDLPILNLSKAPTP